MGHSVGAVRIFRFHSDLNGYLFLVGLDVILHDEYLLRMHLKLINDISSLIRLDPSSSIQRIIKNDCYFISNPAGQNDFILFSSIADAFQYKERAAS